MNIVKLPDTEVLRISAIQYFRDLGLQKEADLLSRCKLEIGNRVITFSGGTLGLYFTLRCNASDLQSLEEDNGWVGRSPTKLQLEIREAFASVLSSGYKIHEFCARAFLVKELGTSDLVKMIETQKDLMISVSTGGPKIQDKNDEYKERRKTMAARLAEIKMVDPNPFDDLWAWYGRWSSGDLPSYQSRREYVRKLYAPLLDAIAAGDKYNPSEPPTEPTGWDRVDRNIEAILSQLGRASREEEFQTVGLHCRECLISLAQAIYNPEIHKSADNKKLSETDAFGMLEAFFLSEFGGSSNECLRKHAKAALSLANELQHKRTASYKDAALCAEATRTVVNIVAITSGKR